MKKLIFNILKTIPISVKVRMLSLYDCPDHPIYHPEGDTGSHIEIVTNRVINNSDDVNLLFAAILHDICKGDSGKLKSTPDGDYWQNVYHAEQAVKLINSDDNICIWIKMFDGDVNIIKQLVGQHMKIKNYQKGVDGIKGGLGKRKQLIFKEKNLDIWRELNEFSKYDSMLIPFKCDNKIVKFKKYL